MLTCSSDFFFNNQLPYFQKKGKGIVRSIFFIVKVGDKYTRSWDTRPGDTRSGDTRSGDTRPGDTRP